MVDFTSALYLGFRHSWRELEPWCDITEGRPAELSEPSAAKAAAVSFAGLQRCEAAVLAPSTLHLFQDVFGMLSRERLEVLVDAGTYAVARWGADNARCRGASVSEFAHHDPIALERRLGRRRNVDRRLVIFTDGLCPACGRVAPIRDYLRVTRERRGLLIVDDTQALGVIGTGGGGTLPYWRINRDSSVVALSSLAKGFGAPLAVLAGAGEFVERFKALSLTRVHCSPPSNAALAAARNALRLNTARGDRLRCRLRELIRHFRRRLRGHGIRCAGGGFPVQTPVSISGVGSYARLLERGIRPILRRDRKGSQPITFLITARHTEHELDRAVDAIAFARRSL